MSTIPLAVTLILAPDVYLSLLFTEQYSRAGVAVVAPTVGYLLNASFGPEGLFLEILGYSQFTLSNTYILVVVNGVLDIFLVPRFGILGAAIATGTALTVAGLAGIIEIYLLHSIIAASRKLLRVWIAVAFPAIAEQFVIVQDLEYTQLAFFLSFVVVCTYILGLRVTDGSTKKDQEIVSRIDVRIGHSILIPVISSTFIWSLLFNSENESTGNRKYHMLSRNLYSPMTQRRWCSVRQRFRRHDVPDNRSSEMKLGQDDATQICQHAVDHGMDTGLVLSNSRSVTIRIAS